MKKILLFIALLVLLSSNVVYAEEIILKTAKADKVAIIRAIGLSIRKTIDVATEEIEKIKTNIYCSRTIEEMKKHDYYNESITGISTQKVDEHVLQQALNKHGRLISKGMPTIEYKAAMENEWVDESDYYTAPEPMNIDLTQVIDYDTYVDILKKLSRYDGVFLYKIGKSTDGRDMYSIEIDVESDYDKKVIMLSGQQHSREFAGGVFILKQLTDLIKKAQWDPVTMELLKRTKYTAVPIISLDVREGIIKSPERWTTSGGQLWKAYRDGTDGNRNYPGLQCGLVANGNMVKSIISSKPSFANYPGPYGGSANETKAMMKWFYHYIVVEKAQYYLDYHQMGRVIYAGEPWQNDGQFEVQMKFVSNLQSILKNSRGKSYVYLQEEKEYGLQGEGSATADYALSLAVGSKFSPQYGFHVFPHWGKEYTLLQIKDLDNRWVTPTETNKNFAAATLEIGSNDRCLGYSLTSRELIADEYFEYNFDDLLEKLAVK